MDMPKDKTTVRNPVLSAGRGADLLNVQGQIFAKELASAVVPTTEVGLAPFPHVRYICFLVADCFSVSF